MRKFLLTLMIMSLALFTLVGCTEAEDPDVDDPAVEDPMDDEDTMDDEQDIVEIASADEDFSTLVAALQEAGLVSTLEEDGPYTVFAPTNAAFEKLLADLDITAEELLEQPDLESVLTYHVVSGKVMSTDLEDGTEAITVNGQEIIIDLSDGVMINDSMVTTPDIEASNGVIHVVDTVLVPDNFELQ